MPNLWLYVIHHCQAWKQAGAHRHWLPGTVSIQQKLGGGTKLFRAVERCKQSRHSPCAGEAAGRWKRSSWSVWAAAILQELGVGCVFPCDKSAPARWPACRRNGVLREKANGAGGLGLGHEVVLKSLLKTLSPFLCKIYLLAFFVVIVPEACDVMKIPAGRSANIDGSCCPISGDDRAVPGTTQSRAMSVLNDLSLCHEPWDQFAPCYPICLNYRIQVWPPSFLVAYMKARA